MTARSSRKRTSTRSSSAATTRASISSTTADTGRTLLLLKDSYANCFVQFLTPYYDRILMIDPRYYL